MRTLTLALAAIVLAACTIPSLETLSRRQSARAVPTAPASVTVRSGDTVYGIARRYRQPLQAVIDVNGLRPPYTVWPGQVLRMPGGPGHTVRNGESLYGIARTYGVQVDDLARVNGIRPPYTIYVGQRLAIPRPGPTPPAPPVTKTGPSVSCPREVRWASRR